MASIQQLEQPLEQIVRLAARGWPLFPVKPRGKQPLIADWRNEATTDPSRLTLWTKRFADCNWGVVTGPETGFFILDVDGEAGLGSIVDLDRRGCVLPKTLVTRTGRGTHVFLKWPPNGTMIRNSAGKLAAGLDVRGAGGFAVIPPSIHSTGAAYEFIDETAPIAPAQEWLLEMLTAVLPVSRALNKPASTGHREGSIQEGRRNAILASLAGTMRRKGMTLSAIEAALSAQNRECCNPPLPEAEVKEIARSVSRYEPATEKQKVSLRRPELLKLSDVTAREVDWLWKPYLANGMLAMLSGDPAAGKTFIALAIAAAITVGRVPYTGEPCEPAAVLYLSVENSPEHVLRPRFDSLEGEPSRFHLLRGSVTADSERPERGSVQLSDIGLLSDALRQTRARFAIVDPIQSYLGADVDAHRSNETRPVMDGLSRLAEEHGCCILLVRHLGKAQTGRAIHRGLGSVDLTGAVRTELLAGCSPDDPEERALVQLKSNLGQFGASLGYTIEANGVFRWTGESQLTASDILAPERNAEEETGSMAEAKDFLSAALAKGARPAKDVQAEARQRDISDRTLKRAKKELRVLSQKCSMSGAWKWVLPEGGQT